MININKTGSNTFRLKLGPYYSSDKVIRLITPIILCYRPIVRYNLKHRQLL